MPLSQLTVAIALMGMAGCGPTAGLRDEFRVSDVGMPFDQRLHLEISAPIILLGRVLEVNEVGRPRRSSGDRRIGTQLTRIKIEVETVIKGDASSNVTEFYYFAYSARTSEVPLKPRYTPIVGQRRIFFLRPSQMGYRSVRDISDYTLNVSSGTHHRAYCQGMSPGCCIAHILLVPQKDIDVEWFAAYLITDHGAAEVLCSQQTAQQLLQKLTEYPDGRVSDRAQQMIADIQRRAR